MRRKIVERLEVPDVDRRPRYEHVEHRRLLVNRAGGGTGRGDPQRAYTLADGPTSKVLAVFKFGRSYWWAADLSSGRTIGSNWGTRSEALRFLQAFGRVMALDHPGMSPEMLATMLDMLITGTLNEGDKIWLAACDIVASRAQMASGNRN